MTHSYQLSTPRLAFGLVAVAMTAITMSIFVVMPASAEIETSAPTTVAMAMRCAAGL